MATVHEKLEQTGQHLRDQVAEAVERVKQRVGTNKEQRPERRQGGGGSRRPARTPLGRVPNGRPPNGRPPSARPRSGR